MNRKSDYSRQLFLAFAAVALAFVSSTVFVTWRSRAIEAETEALTGNALPSIEVLSTATDTLRDLEAASDDYPDLSHEKQPAARQNIERLWRDVDADLAKYVALPRFPGERELYDGNVPAALRAFEESLAHLFLLVELNHPEEARLAADREVRTSANRLAGHLRHLVQLNSGEAFASGRAIRESRDRFTRTALLLDGAALLLAVGAAVWMRRIFKAHTELMDVHAQLVEGRAAELELFGRRVAHDLLSPLSALSFCLGAFKRASETDPKLADALRRARSCVTRAQNMVDGIFEFSRAGGRPERGERSDVAEIVAQVTEEVRSTEGGDEVEIVVEPLAAKEVACSRGVVTSIVSNIVRNAVKYMSDSELKRIAIRAHPEGSILRVEVEDTGPGVPAGLERDIFEPYVRAEGVTQPGLGLGLATVKRLCEAYGGGVEVRSMAGRGSIFSFTLPRANGGVAAT